MKVLLSATSSRHDKSKKRVIEANSLDEVISKLLIDKELVKALIKKENSCLKEYNPQEFVVTVNSATSKYAVEVEIYDTYRELLWKLTT